MRTIAIGDIHGCNHTLENLLLQITPSITDRLIFLGDLIDRGPSSKSVLDKIIQLRTIGYDVIPLWGNHEKMLVDAFFNQEKENIWLYNGGRLTLDSMGITHAYEIDPTYIDFFYSFEYFHFENNYYFVHAGFSDETNYPLKDYKAMLWTRRESYTSDFFKDKKIVHGHTPVSIDILQKTNLQNSQVINIDTGCIYNNKLNGLGYLTALDVSNQKLHHTRNID